MKKNYITSVALLASCFFSFAQPVLNATDLPANYSADVFRISNFQVLSPGNAGANQVWDFSGIEMPVEPSYRMQVVPVSTAPWVSDFPSANYCLKYNYASPSYTSYSFLELSSTGLEYLGYSTEGSSNNGVILVDTETILLTPYIYTSAFDDTYDDWWDGDLFTFTATYDAYGTLIMPYATYNNVIRQKKTGYFNGGTRPFYTFFSTNPYRIIAAGTFSSEDTNNAAAFYVPTTALSINEIKNENLISVYPNPANTILNLQMTNDTTIDKVVITDFAGKIVLVQNHNANLINVQNLSSGMYILQTFSGNEKYHAKFIKE